MKKRGIIIYMLSFLLSIFFLNNVNAINLKALKEKAKQEIETQQGVNNNEENKKQKVNTNVDEEILKVKNIEIDEKFYDIYKEEVDEKLKLYNEYIKEQNEEKRKAMEARYTYLKQLKKQINEIKTLIDKNEFLYMGNIYLPKNSNLIFFKYHEKLYFIPAFTTKVETKQELDNIEQYIDQKYKKLKEKYKVEQINIIKNKDEFEYLNNEFGLIDFSTISKGLNLFSDTDANIITYPTEAVKEALKEKGINYDTKGIFTFFILNNYDDVMAYKAHYLKSTIKLVSDYFMNVGQNNIGINGYTNNFGYKEILIPLRVIKKQKITVIKEKNPGIFDIFVFLIIIILGGVGIYLGLKKMFNIYNDLE